MKKIALITGGSKGIGLESAKSLHDIGYTVILVARNQSVLDEAVASFSSERAIGIAADVTKEDEVKKVFTQIYEKFGRLDLLFNNAGNNSPAQPIESIDFDEWKRVFDVNVNASFLCAKEAIKMMKSQKPMGGRIINNGSVSAITPRLFTVPYTASKHAITGLTKAISLECRKFNIACGQINIGNAETSLSNRMKKGVYQADGTIKPEAMMDVVDVGASIAMIASMPLSTNIFDLTIVANEMPFVGRG